MQLVRFADAAVFLYTNLANPTSNYTYQQIGYHLVSDVNVNEFTR